MRIPFITDLWAQLRNGREANATFTRLQTSQGTYRLVPVIHSQTSRLRGETLTGSDAIVLETIQPYSENLRLNPFAELTGAAWLDTVRDHAERHACLSSLRISNIPTTW